MDVLHFKECLSKTLLKFISLSCKCIRLNKELWKWNDINYFSINLAHFCSLTVNRAVWIEILFWQNWRHSRCMPEMDSTYTPISPSVMARENLDCEVNEILWPRRNERIDIEWSCRYMLLVVYFEAVLNAISFVNHQCSIVQYYLYLLLLYWK